MENLTQVSKVILFTRNELNKAENHFFKMVTLEVKKFARPSQYEMISTKPNEILYYSDRILPPGEISVVYQMAAVMKDLASTTFCVPVIYRHHCMKNHISQVLECHGNSKRPSKYHLSINFLAQKKTLFSISKKFKTITVFSSMKSSK